ncbi:MAG: DUF2807 domain-containing protein [Parvularculaceae bacterium]|nr:DUF2807 domain-containing protein [Parvularculaceae bacterium]
MKIFLGFLIGLVIAAAIAATAFKVAWGGLTDVGERDRGADISRVVTVADFDRVDIAGVVELDATVGGDYSLTLSGRAEDLDRARAEVVDGVLILDTAHDDGRVGRKIVRHGVTATLSAPALVAVKAAGVVDGSVKGIAGGPFLVDISGVGDLELSGTCDKLDAEVSGVGELEAEALQCRDVMVEVSGVGGASVYASEKVDADIAGIGKIDVYGSPAQVSKTKSSPLGRISIK